MKPAPRRDPGRLIWTYGYALIPPIARNRMGPMEALLNDGHTLARRDARTWEGRFVDETDVTHILVVCDTPDRHLEINRLLEAELARLEAPFLVTESVQITVTASPDPAARDDRPA